jgi:hypothetical protein
MVSFHFSRLFRVEKWTDTFLPDSATCSPCRAFQRELRPGTTATRLTLNASFTQAKDLSTSCLACRLHSVGAAFRGELHSGGNRGRDGAFSQRRAARPLTERPLTQW